MININTYVTEKLKLDKDFSIHSYLPITFRCDSNISVNFEKYLRMFTDISDKTIVTINEKNPKSYEATFQVKTLEDFMWIVVYMLYRCKKKSVEEEYKLKYKMQFFYDCVSRNLDGVKKLCKNNWLDLYIFDDYWDKMIEKIKNKK